MISKFILKLLGWNIIGNISKHSVVAVFPHTSYWDGIIGFLVMRAMKINYKVISAEWLFFFPLKYIMKYFLHAFPVGPSSPNAISKSVEILKKEQCNLIICPEGQLEATDKWNMGFYIIAKKANVGVDFVMFDYKNKNIFIYPYSNDEIEGKFLLKEIVRLGNMFVCAKYPDKFKLPKYE